MYSLVRVSAILSELCTVRCECPQLILSELCTVWVLVGSKTYLLYGVAGCSHFRDYMYMYQELMSHYALPRKNVQNSVPILCQITLQNTPCMDFNLLVLTSLEVATVDSQEPIRWLLNDVGANIQLTL